MITAQEWVWLTEGGLLIFAVVLCTVFVKRRRAQVHTLRHVQRQFNGMPVRVLSSSAYFRGMERNWDGQWRGRGVLILTDEMLYFRLWKRPLDLSVPVGRVETVTVIGNGRRVVHRKHLQVTYRGPDDQLRVATWVVKRPQEWIHCMKEALEGSVHNGKAEEKHLSENEDSRGSRGGVGA